MCRTPHALHSVFGPSGPLRQRGVFCVLQFAQVTPARGGGAPSSSAAKRRVSAPATGAPATGALAIGAATTARAGARNAGALILCVAGIIGAPATGGWTLTFAGELALALSSMSEGTLTMGANAGPRETAPPRLKNERTSINEGGAESKRVAAAAAVAETSARNAALGKGKDPGNAAVGGLRARRVVSAM